ncbi:MAG: LPS export ABC transporter periplasmic protein LptC [Gemmatirosa sp.]
MSRRTPRLVGIAILAAALVAACQDTKPPTLPARGVIPDSADQVMFGLRHFVWSGGLRRAQLLSDTAFFYDQMNRIELRNVRAIFYTANGDSNGVMTAQRGSFDVRNQRLEGRGDVKISTVDGRRLASPQLVWERLSNQVTSDTSFTFTDGTKTISGIGLRTDPQLRNLQVLRAASGSAPVGSPAPRARRTRRTP